MHLLLKYSDTKSLVRITFNFLGFANSVILRMRLWVSIWALVVMGDANWKD